jgi:hypothetical protein
MTSVVKGKCQGSDKDAKLCLGPPCDESNQVIVPSPTQKPRRTTRPPSTLTVKCCESDGRYFAAGDLVYKTNCMTIYCSMSCRIDYQLNESCGLLPQEKPPSACFPSECGKAPSWRIKKIVS